MSSFGAVKERTFTLIETGEYALTLNDLSFENGTYGDSLKWVWLIAPKDDPTSYFARDDGMEKTLHQYTDADIVIGSRQHEWVQALTGRQFADGDDPPEDDDVMGKRMVAYITHEAPKKGPNAGKLREKIVPGSAKPFRLPAPKAKAAPAAVESVSADPTEDEVDRALVISKLRKQVARLIQLDAVSGAEAQKALDASDLDTAPLDALESLLASVKAGVTRALADD